MELELKAKHFVDAVFTYPCGCAISKAAKEVFPDMLVFELVDKLRIALETSEEIYFHEDYDQQMFVSDKEIADASTDPEKVIRTIVLVKQEIPIKT